MVLRAAKAAKAKPATRDTGTTVAQNRRGRFDYEILQSYDAGIALLGSEVKSIRAGHATIGEGYARFRGPELFLFNVHIAPYGPARENHEPMRTRKLLLHRRELERLRHEMEIQPRSTIIPLRMFLSHGVIKVEIALAQGKRSYDKRETIREREADRTMQRAVRHAQR
ncbi:MAG: SsrA-binding protein SmpB [Dehalococcoidia bacterium]|nr:MAG: SsrA-binding protein SmpB [Dehalococcoidia bacterium]